MVRAVSLHNTHRHTLRPAFRRLPLYACAVMIACLGDRIAGPNAPPSPGAVPVVHNLVESVVGCWQVSIGRWEPNMSIGEDTIFSRPPRACTISLSSRPAGAIASTSFGPLALAASQCGSAE